MSDMSSPHATPSALSQELDALCRACRVTRSTFQYTAIRAPKISEQLTELATHIARFEQVARLTTPAAQQASVSLGDTTREQSEHPTLVADAPIALIDACLGELVALRQRWHHAMMRMEDIELQQLLADSYREMSPVVRSLVLLHDQMAEQSLSPTRPMRAVTAADAPDRATS